MLYRDIPTLEKEVPIVQENNILFAPARGSLFRILTGVDFVTNFDASHVHNGVENAIVGLKTLIGGIIDFSASLTFELALANTQYSSDLLINRWELRLDGVAMKQLSYARRSFVGQQIEGTFYQIITQHPNFKASLICRFKDVYDPRVANRVLNRNHLVGALA